MPAPTCLSFIELALSITCADSFNGLHLTDVLAGCTFAMSLMSAMTKRLLSTPTSTVATADDAGSCA
jgi:hypothetical protein